MNRPLLLTAAAATLLLAGCGTWWHQQQLAKQRRQEHARCLQRRTSLEQRLGQIGAEQQALRRLAEARYVPSPQPPEPDPALASRFSQLDRQLDDERYAKQLAQWQSAEVSRRAAWEQSQRSRSAHVSTQLNTHLTQLAQIDPALVAAGKPDPQVVARLSRCPSP